MFLDVKKLDKKEHLIGFFGVDLEGKFDYLQKSLTKSDSRFSKFSNYFMKFRTFASVYHCSAARKFEQKAAKFLKTTKDLHQRNSKISKDLHQRPLK